MRPRQLARSAGSITHGLDIVATTASMTGAALLGWSSYLHFHLWRDLGYRHVPVIGTLFVLQAVTGVVVTVVIAATRRAWAALLGAGFSASTVAGLVISIDRGLFGFRDSWSAPFARQAAVIESVAVALLVAGAVLWILGPNARR